MPRVVLGDLLTRLKPGVTAARARRQLEHEPLWLKALEREIARLKLLCQHERPHWRRKVITAGADEVGRGPLAGPMLAAAVAFGNAPFIPGLKDSKLLSPQERELMVPWIEHCALGFVVTRVEVHEISTGNMHYLSLNAMARAVQALGLDVGHLLVDGCHTVPWTGGSQQAIVKGDRNSAAIAAASVLAKVTRDREMVELSRRYPGYGLEQHKGYGTAEHLAALERLGPCPIHRSNFAPVRRCEQGELF